MLCLMYLQGEWRCPVCVAGGPVVATAGGDGTAAAASLPRGGRRGAQRGKTDRQKFLSGGIDLGRIDALWRQGVDTMVRVRWYCRPEDTELGRQVSHITSFHLVCVPAASMSYNISQT